MTVDLVTYGETMGLFENVRIGPLRLGGPMRLSMAGAESQVADARIVHLSGITPDWEGLPTRAEVNLLRGHDVLR